MRIAPIAFEDGTLRLLDQTQLPGKVVVFELREWPEVARAIEEMRVRGAPAIGIAAAYGVALAARAYEGRADVAMRMIQAAAGLVKARPTAVNLAWAVHRVLDEIRPLMRPGEKSISQAAEASAARIHEEDRSACRRIGEFGAALLPAGADVLTHCNTGSLATGGDGTALGVIRSAWRTGALARVIAAETRPLLQGARLTVWELLEDGIPCTLITDSMAASYMARGLVSAVVVGADRIAKNGDTANKIGTYGLAVLAKAHGIPFYVAAPRSTLDPAIACGADIPIEHRNPDEVTSIHGLPIAPAGAHAENPAFDITPADHITAIVTEFGVLQPPLPRSIGELFAQNVTAAVQ
jgi:methylthioribose-1-phosphate isomerase